MIINFFKKFDLSNKKKPDICLGVDFSKSESTFSAEEQVNIISLLDDYKKQINLDFFSKNQSMALWENLNDDLAEVIDCGISFSYQIENVDDILKNKKLSEIKINVGLYPLVRNFKFEKLKKLCDVYNLTKDININYFQDYFYNLHYYLKENKLNFCKNWFFILVEKILIKNNNFYLADYTGGILNKTVDGVNLNINLDKQSNLLAMLPEERIFLSFCSHNLPKNQQDILLAAAISPDFLLYQKNKTVNLKVDQLTIKELANFLDKLKKSDYEGFNYSLNKNSEIEKKIILEKFLIESKITGSNVKKTIKI